MNKVTNVVLGGGSLKTSCSNDFESIKDSVIASRRSLCGNLMTKPAFTLAEVLITLGIIGVVAALTIPALMQSTNNKELVSGTLKMGTVLSNALKGMEAHDMVSVDKLTDLDTFGAKFKSQLKTVNCTDHSVCLADGAYFDYSNPQFGGHCDKETPCVEIVADINGKKGPNKQGKDQYTFLVTNRGIIPLGEQTTCTGLDCTAYVLANHKLWEGETVEINPQAAELPQETPQETPTPVNTYPDAVGKTTLTVNGQTKDYYISDVTAQNSYSPVGDNDYWQAANDICTSKGMKLPTVDEFNELYKQKGSNGIPTSEYYWTSSFNDKDYDTGTHPHAYILDNGSTVSYFGKGSALNVLCVGN